MPWPPSFSELFAELFVQDRSRPAAQGPVENHVLVEDRLVFERVRKLARP